MQGHGWIALRPAGDPKLLEGRQGVDRAVVGRAWRLTTPYHRRLAAYVGLIVVIAVVSAAPPQLIRLIIDRAIPAGDTGLRGCGTSGAASASVSLRPRRDAPIGILTGEYGARVLTPLVASLGRDDVRVIPVRNEFFGGNTAVTGLLVGEDLTRVLATQPAGHRYLLPDVCLSEGRFLDGTTIEELPRAVEVLPTDGIALRRALEAFA